MCVQLQLFPTNDHLETYQRSEKIYAMYRDGYTGAEIARIFHMNPYNVYRIINERKNRDESLWKAIENAVFDLGFDPFTINRAHRRLVWDFGKENATLDTLKNMELSKLAEGRFIGDKLLQVYDYIQKH